MRGIEWKLGGGQGGAQQSFGPSGGMDLWVHSQMGKLIQALDPATASRYMASLQRSLGSSYDPTMTGALRQNYRDQAMALDPNSLANSDPMPQAMPGVAKRFDDGGIVAPRTGGASRGGILVQALGGASGMPEKPTGTNPAIREAALRREAAFQKSIRDRYGDTEESEQEKQMKALQLREQALQNRALQLQNRGLEAGLGNDRRDHLLKLLQVAGGLRF